MPCPQKLRLSLSQAYEYCQSQLLSAAGVQILAGNDNAMHVNHCGCLHICFVSCMARTRVTGGAILVPVATLFRLRFKNVSTSVRQIFVETHAANSLCDLHKAVPDGPRCIQQHSAMERSDAGDKQHVRWHDHCQTVLFLHERLFGQAT